MLYFIYKRYNNIILYDYKADNSDVKTVLNLKNIFLLKWKCSNNLHL